jgi:serine/threonine-protein kinase HipA
MSKQETALSVRLYGREVGILEQHNGRMRFKYQPNAPQALSLSLPIQPQVYTEKACKAYFGGLLPESETTRQTIARQHRINPNNDFALLAAIGRDCAGAVSFHALNEPIILEEALVVEGEPLTDDELEAHILNLPLKPLSLGRRLSLAGAQEKTALSLIDGRLALPLNNSPTTHIIKPAIRGFEESVSNEYICMKTAQAYGLNVPSVERGWAKSTPFFLISRFDRRIVGSSQIRRLQQEDFTQALGIATIDKYEVTFKQCLQVLQQVAKPALDKHRFIQQVVFNYLIGNCDAHGKNFSVVYHENNSIALSPVYDVLCTSVYEGLDTTMAMKIGKAHRIDAVTRDDWHLFAKDLEVAFSVVEAVLKEQVAVVPQQLERIVNEVDAEIGVKILNFTQLQADRTKHRMGF